jgi:myo-inositol-1-phosphate synthase
MKVGVWLVGAMGTVATTVFVGACALSRELVGSWGLVSELSEIKKLPLVAPEHLVFGGWDVAEGRLMRHARVLAREDRALPADIVEAVERDIEAIETEIQPGFLNDGPSLAHALGLRPDMPDAESLAQAAERLGKDLERFREKHRLDTVVVVNVASTEPPFVPKIEHGDLAGFRRLLAENRREAITPALLYAYVAFEHGYPYIDFTPSPSLGLPALQELANLHGVPFYGRDGKTGETLLKTVLAPLFRLRNLEVLSWEGFNILGGGDGQVLGDPDHKQSKLRSKGGVLTSALGYNPHAGVFIEYVPSLGNWKTAWDFIHFRGFLGTKMSLQFIWQGCDAILAAPLVLDLVRLTEFARRRGEVGPMAHLACFFKDPLGVVVHSFADQFRLLIDYVEHRAKDAVYAEKS